MAAVIGKSKNKGSAPKRIWGLVTKEIRLLLKDKFAMLIIFALPIMLVFVIDPPWAAGRAGGGGNLRGESMEVPVLGYIDLDKSEGLPYDLSSGMVDIMKEFEEQNKVALVLGANVTYLDELLGKGTIHGYIILPDGLEYNISMHFPGIFTAKFDTLNSILLEKVQGIVEDIQMEAKARYNLSGVFDQKITEVGMPPKAQKLFQTAPIFFPLTIFAIAALTTAQSIVSDVPKDRVLLTPANRFEVVTSKLLANEILILIQATVIVSLSYGLGLQTIGSPLLLFGILAVVGLAGICLGLAISAMVGSPLAALQLFIFVFLFQMIIMLFSSGWILSIFPMYNGMELTMNLVMRGENPFISGLLPTLYTVIWILGFYGLTLAIFSKRKSML